MSTFRAFTLTELLVGILVSLMLVSAMATFLGDAGYTFQGHKAVMQDRSQLQRTLMALTRDLMFIGENADDDGIYQTSGEDSTSFYYMEVANEEGTATGTSLSYYLPMEDLDSVTDVLNSDRDINLIRVTFAVSDETDPVTGDAIKVLNRNGEPYLLDVTEFSVEFGVDADGNNLVGSDEWTDVIPEDDAARTATYGNLRKLRITLGRNTKTSEGETFENRLIREIMLRNRGGDL